MQEKVDGDHIPHRAEERRNQSFVAFFLLEGGTSRVIKWWIIEAKIHVSPGNNFSFGELGNSSIFQSGIKTFLCESCNSLVFFVLLRVTDRTPPGHDEGHLPPVPGDPLLHLLTLLPLLPGVRDNSIKTYNKLTNKAVIQTLSSQLCYSHHDVTYWRWWHFTIEDSLENLMKKLFQFSNWKETVTMPSRWFKLVLSSTATEGPYRWFTGVWTVRRDNWND